MKKIVLGFVFLLFACGNAGESLDKNKVYFFFSNGCPHCHEALEYIDKNYAHTPITMVNVSTPGGYDLCWKAAKHYKLKGNIGTPMITFGDKYMLGWGRDSARQFDEYIRPFLNRNK